MDLFSLTTNVHWTPSTFYCLNVVFFGFRSKDKSFLASSLRSSSRGYTDEAKNSSLYPTNHLPSSDLSLNSEARSQTRDRPLILNTHLHRAGRPSLPTGRSRSHVSLVFQLCRFGHCSRILTRLLKPCRVAERSPQAAFLPWQVSPPPGDALGRCLTVS